MALDFLKKMLARSSPNASSRVEREANAEERESPSFETAVSTRASAEHPDRNEDATLVDAERKFLLLADGAGGAGNGDVMSAAVRASAENALASFDGWIARERGRAAYPSAEHVEAAAERLMRQLVSDARQMSEQVMQRQQLLPKDRPSSTAIFAKAYEVSPGNWRATIASVGDSKAYVAHPDGSLTEVPLAEDNLIAEFVAKDRVSPDEADYLAQATSRESMVEHLHAYYDAQGVADDVQGKRVAYMENLFAEMYQRRRRAMITQAAGATRPEELNLEGHVRTVVLKPGDRLMLVSDGVPDNLPRAEVRNAARSGKTLDAALASVTGAATERSQDTESARAKADDITAVGIEVPVPEGTRIPDILQEVGFDDDIAYLTEKTVGMAAQIEAVRDARASELAALDLLERRANGDSVDQAAYRRIMTTFIAPLGSESQFLLLARLHRSELTQMETQLAETSAELAYWQARQELFDLQAAANQNDPESPLWAKRLAAAQERVSARNSELVSRHKAGFNQLKATSKLRDDERIAAARRRIAAALENRT